MLPDAAWADDSLGLFLCYIEVPAGPSRVSHGGGRDETLRGVNRTVPLKQVSVLSATTFNTAETAANAELLFPFITSILLDFFFFFFPTSRLCVGSKYQTFNPKSTDLRKPSQ